LLNLDEFFEDLVFPNIIATLLRILSIEFDEIYLVLRKMEEVVHSPSIRSTDGFL